MVHLPTAQGPWAQNPASGHLPPLLPPDPGLPPRPPAPKGQGQAFRNVQAPVIIGRSPPPTWLPLGPHGVPATQGQAARSMSHPDAAASGGRAGRPENWRRPTETSSQCPPECLSTQRGSRGQRGPPYRHAHQQGAFSLPLPAEYEIPFSHPHQTNPSEAWAGT